MKRFLVITGLPASGKSTVGAALSTALGLLWLDKDEILEALFDGLGVGDADWRRRLSRSADLVLQRLALGAPGAVISSWWRHPSSRIPSGTPVDWLRTLPGEVIEIHCRCSPAIAADRFFARSRHRGHLDSLKSKADELARFEQLAEFGPLRIGSVIEVNTEYSFEVGEVVPQIESL